LLWNHLLAGAEAVDRSKQLQPLPDR
jgi:hypothetical protein